MKPNRSSFQASPDSTRAAVSPVKNLRVYLVAIFSLLAASVLLTAVTTYVAIRSQLQQQQQREIQRSQDFNQLRNVLILPFQLSKWMSRDAFLLDWLKHGEKNPEQALQYLKEISDSWQVSAFVASNLTRTYYFSDGTSKALTRATPDVEWFFQLIEHKVEALADVGYDNGNTNKPFLYIDIRVPDIDGKSAGYVGTAVELRRFLDLLNSYLRAHGDELHFVNQDHMVVLSSTSGIVNTPAEQYNWYRLLDHLSDEDASGKEQVIEFENQQGHHFSLHREWLAELGWHVYTVRDLQPSQSRVYAIMLKTIGLITLLVMVALTVMTLLLRRFRQDLRNAFAQIRTLKGILPICCSCKKIRDDQGYWQQLESYLHQHSEADLSHGICPECARKLYPELKLQGLEREESP